LRNKAVINCYVEIKKRIFFNLLCLFFKQLKEDWVDKDIKRLSDDLTNLIAPFSSQDDFNIILKKDNELFPQSHKRSQKN
jgi:hypothetical protein